MVKYRYIRSQQLAAGTNVALATLVADGINLIRTSTIVSGGTALASLSLVQANMLGPVILNSHETVLEVEMGIRIASETAGSGNTAQGGGLYGSAYGNHIRPSNTSLGTDVLLAQPVGDNAQTYSTQNERRSFMHDDLALLTARATAGLPGGTLGGELIDDNFVWAGNALSVGQRLRVKHTVSRILGPTGSTGNGWGFFPTVTGYGKIWIWLFLVNPSSGTFPTALGIDYNVTAHIGEWRTN